jgi:hypothetical protein
MERQEIINYARIATDIFLIVVIGLMVWQFIRADTITKDIALSNQPSKLVTTYENITGLECVCGKNIKDYFVTSTTPMVPRLIKKGGS